MTAILCAIFSPFLFLGGSILHVLIVFRSPESTPFFILSGVFYPAALDTEGPLSQGLEREEQPSVSIPGNVHSPIFGQGTNSGNQQSLDELCRASKS
jgi:hypothetical protein